MPYTRKGNCVYKKDTGKKVKKSGNYPKDTDNGLD